MIKLTFSFFNKKRGQHIDLMGDIMMFGLIIVILIIAIVLSKSYSQSVSNDLVERHMQDISLNYNLMTLLHQKTSDGKYVSDVIRSFCTTGNSDDLDAVLSENFLKIMKNAQRYKIIIDKEYCNGHDYEKIVQKGEIKRKYVVISPKCYVVYERSTIFPNIDSNQIILKVQSIECEGQDEK